MTLDSLDDTPVLVIGAGIMGAGIAQVAAQAGHRVLLHDARAGAAEQARTGVAKGLDGLVAKGRMSADDKGALLERIAPLHSLADGAHAGLAIEAIVEKLDAKRALFLQLEEIVGDDCVLATNTSSISVTAIANGLRRPARLVGMHFFNPVPQMKLVEVVAGLQTDAAVAEAVFALAGRWGKVPVHARSTPGFIVNRIARPYYAETLALLLEQAAPPEVLDACLRGAGFRMGPCELMDLIGHDTNFAVTSSVYEANFFDKRFVPSLVQRELVDGGLLGRKSGRGFYAYPAGAPALPAPAPPAPLPAACVTVHGRGERADALAAAVASAADRLPDRVPDSDWTGLAIDDAFLVLTDGRCASTLAQALGTRDVAVFDRLPAPMLPAGSVLAWTLAEGASDAWAAAAPAWLAALGVQPQRVEDTPGLVVARTIAMLVNEAADAVLQRVCRPEAADAAMKLGVNWPAGPFEWLDGWGAAGVIALLEALDAHYRGERYRASPWLRRLAQRQASGPDSSRSANVVRS